MQFDINQPSEKYRVLIVDDDQFLNMLICAHLENDSFEAISAYSLREAKEKLKSGELIDIILLDYQLGDGDGVELLRFDSEFPYIERSPVIMISANDNVDFLEDCFSCGASDYIIKPINFKLLSLKAKTLIQSIKLKNIINAQYEKLSEYKVNAEREEVVAKFTYEYLVRRANQEVDGVSVWQKPFSAFSGDIVLVRVSPAGDLYIVMADATGHGLSAAITVMPLISTFNSMVSKGFHLQIIMAEVNRKLVSDTPDDRFVAAIGMEISNARGIIAVWNGGMPPVYLVNEHDMVHQFNSRHLALGIQEDDDFDASVEELKLPENGSLFLYSDGLIEQENPKGNAYSKSRLIDVLLNPDGNLLNSVLESFSAHVGDANYTDDVSMCVIDINRLVGSLRVKSEIPLSIVSEKEGKYIWTFRVSGSKLAKNEIMPLIQHFSQHMDIQQSVRQKIFIVASEMINNALDHGVLGLSSSLKELENGFHEYHCEREKRLSMLDPASYLELILSCETHADNVQISIKVKDSGKGYADHSQKSTEGLLNSGRGLKLIKQLSKEVRVDPPGNVIEAILS